MDDLKKKIFLILSFIILTVSYSTNIFHISHEKDLGDEALIMGRLLRSQQDGIFSYGGLPGRNLYISEAEPNYLEQSLMQYNYYVNEDSIPDLYNAYMSQTGGQAIVYSIVQEIAPVKPITKVLIFRIINGLLTALCFTLFFGWICRNFNLTSAVVTFILIFFSNWINSFAYNLWWALWSFYIPFISMLLFYEKRQSNPAKYTDKKMLIILFLAVFAKGIFTGFEFITTTVFSALCPMIYYSVLEHKKIKDLVKPIIKSGVVMGLAIAANMLVLTIQIKFYLGTFEAGIKHIIYSFVKRSTFIIEEEGITEPEGLVSFIVRNYFGGNAFNWGFMTEGSFRFPFILFFIILAVCSVLIWKVNKRLTPTASEKNKALLITTCFSVLSPASWYIIFNQHAYIHTFLDYIVWYMPFLFFVFMVIGHTIHIFASRSLIKSEAK